MPTTAAYRQVLAQELGFWLSLTTTSGASVATDLICTSLIDSDLEASFLDGVWSLLTSTNSGQSQLGTVRRVKANGLAATTGTVTHTRAFSSTTSVSTTFELFGVLPPTDQLGRRGLLTCMNLALRECWDIDFLPITGVANQYQYPLSTSFPWLTSEDQVIDVWVRRSGASRDTLVAEWRFIADAELPQIEFKAPFTTSDTIKVQAYRPADTWIGTGTPSTWAESTTGLVSDSDVAMLSLDAMKTVGLVHCFAALATVGDETERQSWAAKASAQRLKANMWKRANLRRETGRDVHWRTVFSALVPAFPLEGSLST